MTLRELLKKEVKSRDTDISVLVGFYYNHINELTENTEIANWNFWNWFHKDKYESDHKVEILYFANKYFDFRRCWKLGVLMYMDKPVMVFQNAGRDGDDYFKRFIISENEYKSFIDYMRTLIKWPDVEVPKEVIYDMDIDILGLTKFYNHDLDSIEYDWY